MLRRKLSKVLVSILTVLTIFSSTGFSIASAEPIVSTQTGIANPSTITVQQSAQAIENNLTQFDSSISVASYKGCQGIFYNLNTILTLSVWVNFLNTNKDIPVAQNVIDRENAKLTELITGFNKDYSTAPETGVTTSKTKSAVVPQAFQVFTKIPDPGKGPVSVAECTAIAQSTATMLNNYLSSFVGSSKEISTKEIEEIVKNNKTTLNLINLMVSNYKGTINHIYNYLPLSIRNKYNYPSQTSPNNTGGIYVGMSNALNLVLNRSYVQNILNKATKMSVAEMGNIAVNKINTDTSVINQFYKGELYGKNAELNSIYYLMLSTSAIYTPFKSYVGDDKFIQTLQYLTRNNPQQQDIMNLYQNAHQYLKPLYYAVGNSTTGYAGNDTINGSTSWSSTAKRLTLSKLIELADSENSGTSTAKIVVGKGVLQKPADADMYSYYNNQQIDVTAQGEKNATKTAQTTTSSEETKKTSSTFVQAGGEELTNPNNWSDPLFYVGSYGPGAAFTDMLITNTSKDCGNIKELEAQDTGLLFMNPFGDVVTAQGLVIIPGSSNPGFYGNSQTYFPYTMAFMASYPQLSTGTEVFSATSSKSTDKYLIGIDPPSSVTQTTAQDGKTTTTTELDGSVMKTPSASEIKLYTVQGTGNVNMALAVNNMSLDVYTSDTAAFQSLMSFKKYTFGSDLNPNSGVLSQVNSHINIFSKIHGYFAGALSNTFANYYWMRTTPLSTQNGIEPGLLYDSSGTQESVSNLAMIVKIYYQHIMADNKGTVQQTPNSVLNTKLLSQTIMPEMMNGVQNPAAYIKNSVHDFNYWATHASDWISNTITGMAGPTIQKLSNITGVLGLQSTYSNPVMAKILFYASYYKIAFILIMIALIAIKIIRTTLDLIGGVVIGLITIAVMFAMINVVPLFLPTVINFLNDNNSREIANTSLMMQAENYGQVFTQEQGTDGNQANVTSSLTLYKMTSEQMQDLATSMAMAPNALATSTPININAQTGIYAQGNEIKINIDKLLSNNPIVGGYFKTGDSSVKYQDHAGRVVPSCVDYYMPYHLIEDNFIGQLNKFASIYNINRITLNYGGVSKDSFLVTAFMKSAPFLTPGSFKDIQQTTNPVVLGKLEANFPTGDWMNLGKALFDTSTNPQIENTLWYKTLKELGWTTKEKELDLVSYVNYHLKQFMIDNEVKFQGMSDANIIKIISLQANLLINQKVSTPYHALYPMFLNYSDINLGQVMLATYTNSFNMFESSNMTIAPYIQTQYGWFAVIGFTGLAFVIAMCTFLMQWMIPLFYILFCILLLIRYVTGGSAGLLDYGVDGTTEDRLEGTVKGFGKSLLTIFVCFSAQVFFISVMHLKIFTYTQLGIWLLLVIELVILNFLLRLIYVILANLGQFGQGQYADKILPRYLSAAFARIASTSVGSFIADKFIKGRDKVVGIYNSNPYDVDYDMDDDDIDELHVFTRGVKGRSRVVEVDLDDYKDSVYNSHSELDDDDNYDQI